MVLGEQGPAFKARKVLPPSQPGVFFLEHPDLEQVRQDVEVDSPRCM